MKRISLAVGLLAALGLGYMLASKPVDVVKPAQATNLEAKLEQTSAEETVSSESGEQEPADDFWDIVQYFQTTTSTFSEYGRFLANEMLDQSDTEGCVNQDLLNAAKEQIDGILSYNGVAAAKAVYDRIEFTLNNHVNALCALEVMEKALVGYTENFPAGIRLKILLPKMYDENGNPKANPSFWLSEAMISTLEKISSDEAKNVTTRLCGNQQDLFYNVRRNETYFQDGVPVSYSFNNMNESDPIFCRSLLKANPELFRKSVNYDDSPQPDLLNLGWLYDQTVGPAWKDYTAQSTLFCPEREVFFAKKREFLQTAAHVLCDYVREHGGESKYYVLKLFEANFAATSSSSETANISDVISGTMGSCSWP